MVHYSAPHCIMIVLIVLEFSLVSNLKLQTGCNELNFSKTLQ
jgi:hypothetical protein